MPTDLHPVVRWLRRRAQNIAQGIRGLAIEAVIVGVLIVFAFLLAFVVVALR